MCSAPTEASAKAERLFFALWPDDDFRQQLHRHCKSLLRHAGGRPVPIDKQHITLAFLGNVDAEQRQCIETMADAIHCPSFELNLDKAGHWSRSRVLWLAPTQTPEPLSALASALHAGASDCGLKMESRPFRAHLTLKRKLNRAPQELAFRPLPWRVESFVLVRSVTYQEGVQYEVLREWPLMHTTPEC
jgi:2'-5' RNA ligase